jgi:predicted flap endonuclease-1-like 5' DNA nuclease
MPPVEDGELARLRALVSEYETEAARVVEVAAAPVDDEAKNLQAWRLRYFEQRVRYLEGLQPVAQPSAELEWRAREAEARAAHLESEVRALSAPREPESQAEAEPFAANAEVDMALRWRMLYLEKRVAYLQSELDTQPEPIAAPAVDAGPDPEIWKWRSHYLEARVRHLEQAPPAPVVKAADALAEEPPPAPQAPRGLKPPVLSAPRNGLPDDFTLIEGVSGLQQSTLNALGVFHFDQIAAWAPEHVAWVDRYLYLRGRIEEEEWVEQAGDLAREGVSASRRALAEEEA